MGNILRNPLLVYIVSNAFDGYYTILAQNEKMYYVPKYVNTVI